MQLDSKSDQIAFKSLLKVRPAWTGIRRASDVLELVERSVLHAGPPFSLLCLHKIMRGQLRVGEMHTSTATRDSRSVSFCHKTCSKRRPSRAGAGVAGSLLVGVVGVVGGGHPLFAPVL